MKHIITFIAFTFFCHAAFADQAADKAKFKKLYAEFNELFENSEDIDPIIDVAEKLYRIAPFAYGEVSQQYAVVTYNLALLYDEKGGDETRPFGLQNNFDVRAINLYKLYFDKLEKLDTAYSQTHIDQYLEYLSTDAHYYKFKSNDRASRKLLEIAQSMELPASELAQLCFKLGDLRIEAKHRDQSKYFYQSAYDILKKANEDNHELLGRSAQILAVFESASGNNPEAEIYFLEAISVFNSQAEKDTEKLKMLYSELARLYVFMGNETDAKIYNDKLAELNNLPG